VPTELNDSERRALRQKVRAATLDGLQTLGGEARREAIVDWALAQGGFTARELGAPSPEKAAEKHPRLVDYYLSWEPTNLKRDGLIENPKWGTWRLTSAALPPVTTAVEEQLSSERLAELRAMPYRQYLRTHEWRRTRSAALVRAGNACSLDVTHTEHLEVHHRTYERLGAELINDLVVLCHACHQLHHKEHGRPSRERPVAPTSRGLADDGTAASSSSVTRARKPSLLRRLLIGLTRAASS
jgi:restriction endonuclease Mrr